MRPSAFLVGRKEETIGELDRGGGLFVWIFVEIGSKLGFGGVTFLAGGARDHRRPAAPVEEVLETKRNAVLGQVDIEDEVGFASEGCFRGFLIRLLRRLGDAIRAKGVGVKVVEGLLRALTVLVSFDLAKGKGFGKWGRLAWLRLRGRRMGRRSGKMPAPECAGEET